MEPFLQKACASPPYRFGSSLGSITESKTLVIPVVPLPTTLTVAHTLEEINGLNNLTSQVVNIGMLTKNVLDCEGMRVGACMGNQGRVL